MEAPSLRSRLVDLLVERGFIRSPAVESAFRSVPRHVFLPGLPEDVVYSDEAIPTHVADGVPISSSSQPAIMAEMLEQLDVHEGDRVLEIGTGTGYNAALLAVLAGPTGHVTSVELEKEFADEARAALAAAGFGAVEVICGDGFKGYPPNAPYDRIIVTAAAPSVAPAWTEQLKVGGRVVVPLIEPGTPPTQVSAAFEKTDRGLRLLSSVGCGFMPMR